MKIKQVVFETEDGKKIKLTVEQAKELQQQLNELLGGNITINNHPTPAIPHWLPSPQWSDTTYFKPHDITCGTVVSHLTIAN